MCWLTMFFTDTDDGVMLLKLMLLRIDLCLWYMPLLFVWVVLVLVACPTTLLYIIECNAIMVAGAPPLLMCFPCFIRLGVFLPCPPGCKGSCTTATAFSSRRTGQCIVTFVGLYFIRRLHAVRSGVNYSLLSSMVVRLCCTAIQIVMSNTSTILPVSVFEL